MRIDIDPYDARDRLIQYHVNHVMSLDELRMYVVEDLFSTIKNCPDTMKHLLDRTGISPEDQACIRKYYELEEVSEKESAIIIKWYKGSQVGEFVINASSKQLLFEQFYEEYWKPNYGMPNSTMYRFKSRSLDQEYDEWR